MNPPTVDSKVSFIHSVRAALLALSLMLLFLLTMGVVAKEASARSTRLPDAPKVALTDFYIIPYAKTRHLQEREAAKIVFRVLESSGLYAMTPQAIVDQQRARYPSKHHLDGMAMLEVGKSLGDDFIASGIVTDVLFLKNPRRVRVTLSVFLTDIITARLCNGAIETGIARPTASGGSDKAMVQDALQNVAYRVVATLKNYKSPSATVLRVKTDKQQNQTVILDRGTRDQIESGMEFVVVRGITRVGRIRVTEADPDKSVACILDIGKGIRSGDEARLSFKLSEGGIDPEGSVIRQSP